MRVLSLLTGTVVMVGLAAPAHADPGDDAFLAALTQAGISYQNPDRAIKAGQKVCDLANSGTSQLDIIRDIRDLNPAFSMAKAAKFAQAAANAYCPELLDTSSDTGGGN
ncbi:DUF732 domain-containing protein [Mycobacterium montefiorense]|uniref:DUF732 domain-containing protein n=1 Tax=Mycobacterium montefiorense TaxID=154654 RepID=A0AA37UUZ2_9MYCO|nr:DUF732 domain-containing protein [Mycobacterium montefiorense]GBG38876.1 hypothetical protein MmonteBS_32480 [Mycobacterium montefiorense]GKU32664.1 hypothetical protein NJB14191_00110 [Mycobacterium montefiorense]GKU38186.1 hypothetical protein NJB14192_01840 [Mycobacterium montefiorense]GKU43474.1 hypothetical protein NJB14194_01070 [Mycobacterium montefiorense]GKU50215.1 hypothetical protein NJB14195_14610 [Mycobacterium montefiorense]